MKAKVLVTRYRYVDPDNDKNILSASKGDVIDVTAAELERGLSFGGLAKGADGGEKSIAQMTGAELDDKAAELQVDGWDASAKVADKKTTLQAWVDAHPAE